MINVFRLSNSSNIEDIGYEFPQVQTEWWENFDYWGPESVSKTPLKGPISFKVIFPKFILKDLAKPTDLLSSSNIAKYLMVSRRLFDLLRQSRIDDFQFFVEQVHTPHGVIDYYLIYLNTPRDDEFFDWENCSFYDVNDSERRTFKVKTALEYYDSANGKVLKPERISINPGQPKFDLFRFYYYISGGWFYVSERLKEAIMDAKLTGIQFDPLVCHEAGESVELSGGG